MKLKEDNILFLSNTDLSGLLQATLAKGVPFRFQAKGFSMWPFIRNEDVVTISPMNGSCIKIGMCVAFTRADPSRLAIHRIIGRRKGLYLIKGDNTYNRDGYIPRQDILGYVSAVERNTRNSSVGLGSERRIIVVLSRFRLFNLINQIWRLIPCRVRKIVL